MVIVFMHFVATHMLYMHIHIHVLTVWSQTIYRMIEVDWMDRPLIKCEALHSGTQDYLTLSDQKSLLWAL